MTKLYTLAAACGATNAYENSPKIGFDPEAWAKFESALSAPAVETVAVQEAPCTFCAGRGFYGTPGQRCSLCDGTGKSKIAPLPVAPKAEPTDEQIMEATRAFAADGGRWPSDWIAACRAVLTLSGAQPVVADTLTEAAQDLLDTELSDLACTGSDAPVEDALGRLRDALASPPRAIPAEQAAPTEREPRERAVTIKPRFVAEWQAAEAVRDAAQTALDAYEDRFESTTGKGLYLGPIDEEMKALRAALAAEPGKGDL